MRLVAIATLIGLASPAWAACPASPVALRADMDGAYASYAAFDLATFSSRAAGVDADLACLSGVLDPETAARAHLVEALRAWVAKDPVQMLASFRGMVAADPSYVLSPDIAPEGSRVRTVYEEARLAGAGATRGLPVGAGVVLTVDGRRALDAIPADRASVVQVAPPGGPIQSWYVFGDVLPGGLAAAAAGPGVPSGAPPAPVLPASLPPAHPTHPSRSIVVAGAAAALVSATSLVLAAGAQDQYLENDVVAEEPGIYTRNRAFAFIGYGLGVGAVGLGVTAVIVGKW